MKMSENISNWIKEQVDLSGKRGVIIGLSGGIDSAVVAALSKRALGDNVLGLVLPCRSLSIDEKLAIDFARKFNIAVKKIDLSAMFDYLRCLNPDSSDIARANLKPRLRMITLYYFANSLDYLVAGTGNKSELMIGYFTKHGDGGCDILPIGGLLKTDVRKLAKELKIPDEIISRPPTAGLWAGQTDETEIGMSYECLDRCLTAIDENVKDKIEDGIFLKTRLMIKASEHKRQLPPIFGKK